MRHAKSSDPARHRAVPTVWARIVAALLRRAEAVGVPRRALLEAADLREPDLADPDGRVALEALYAVLETVTARSGDPFAHMRLVRGLELESFDALGFVAMTSPTVRDAFDAFARYQRVFTDGERYHLESDDEWLRVVYTPWGPPRAAHRMMAELFAVDIVVNSSLMTGGPFDRPRVELAHDAPDDRARHAELLGVEAAFGCPRNAVWIRASDAARRIAPEGQEAICAYFHRHLDERVRALPRSSVGGTVRDMLTRAPTLDVSMGTLARQLQMSARTLQRRLGDEGTSLRALVDEVRRARALPLLESGQSIAEIAYLLGYAEPSAFHRAFRRWTKETPESFRARVTRDHG